VTQAHAFSLRDPEQLYLDWERAHWASQDDEEEGSFLSTQLVDEVRHMQFYARFQDEVIADPAAIASHVLRAREVLGDAFERVFDQALVRAHDRLRLDHSDREA
jgi:ribonucleoside-diphosphate reductase beta chain